MKLLEIIFMCLLVSIHLNIQFELNITTPGIQFWPSISAWQKEDPKMVKKISRLLQNCYFKKDGSFNKTGSQYIDGPPVNNNQGNRWNTCNGYTCSLQDWHLRILAIDDHKISQKLAFLGYWHKCITCHY